MVFTITKTKKIKDKDMTERVFITGDKHGTFTPLCGLAEKTVLYESDILIIAGDAGYVWNYLCCFYSFCSIHIPHL